jgi:Fe2+ or Zn2+ uptake regulation protein
MTSVDKVCAKFRDEGRRITPQRRAIVRALLNNGTHPTADQILTRVQREMPNISLATIYNTLHEMEEMGLLKEMDFGLGLKERRYDVVMEAHDHLICLRCGHVKDVPRAADVLYPPEDEDHNFQVVGRRVTYLGYCPDCASQLDVC